MVQLGRKIIFRTTAEDFARFDALRQFFKHKTMSETVRRVLNAECFARSIQDPITSEPSTAPLPLFESKKLNIKKGKAKKKVQKTRKKSKVSA